MSIQLTQLLGIQYPIIVAPMFLISNEEMVINALESGVTAAFPALNYRTIKELDQVISTIKSKTNKPFGVNLIVNKSNPKYKEQLNLLVEKEVDFIITSLGNPKEVIECCKNIKTKVFCDVTDLHYAQKVEGLGADALIAVSSEAGGHAGSIPRNKLIETLTNNCKIPVICAGGIATGTQLHEAIQLGASGASIGTIFLASEEAPISKEYQQALIKYGKNDIVLSSKLSGSPLTVINTPYVQEIGTKASFLERLMNRNKWLKKYLKLIIAVRGMNKVRKAAFSATYKTVWCAGPSIEYIKEIRPIKHILKDLIDQYELAKS